MVGDVRIGGGGAVVVQSMTTTNTANVQATSEEIGRLAEAILHERQPHGV